MVQSAPILCGGYNMILWFAASFISFFIKGLCGFANTLVFTSILSFGAANIEITPVNLLLGYPSNLIMAWRGRKMLRPRLVLPLGGLLIAGDLVGALLLKNVDIGAVRVIFGVMVTGLALQMLIRHFRPARKKDSPLVTVLIALFSGISCGLFGVAAMLVACVSRATDSTEAMKANFSAICAMDNSFRLILYIVMGIMTLSSLKTAAIQLPVALAGLYGGILCSGRLREDYVRILTILLLLISGIVLIAQNL